MSDDTTGFDLFANDYDTWFGDNQSLLESEVRLLAHIWPEPAPKKVLSVGCGTGLFETILARDFDITITDGVEPAEAMAELARTRGMNVTVGDAETTDLGEQRYDMLLFNGSISYIEDLELVFERAYNALRPGGYLLSVDVPRESGFGILYCLAAQLGTWEHPLMQDVAPAAPYPIPFVQSAHWHSTPERIQALENQRFKVLRSAQTLFTNPVHAGEHVEEPRDGHDAGGYVAILAQRTDGKIE